MSRLSIIVLNLIFSPFHQSCKLRASFNLSESITQSNFKPKVSSLNKLICNRVSRFPPSSISVPMKILFLLFSLLGGKRENFYNLRRSKTKKAKRTEELEVVGMNK